MRLRLFRLLTFVALVLLAVLLSLPPLVRSSVGCGNLFYEFWTLYLVGGLIWVSLFVRFLPDMDALLEENLKRTAKHET